MYKFRLFVGVRATLVKSLILSRLPGISREGILLGLANIHNNGLGYFFKQKNISQSNTISICDIHTTYGCIASKFGLLGLKQG